MTDNKLTDKEIVKALECCGKLHIENIDSFCNECIFKGKAMCIGYLCDNSIDLINRLQAENERLKPFEDKIAKFNSHIRVEDMLVFASSLEEWLEFCENLKAEAYKEFAERLKDMSEHFWEEKENFVSEEQIDNLLKELVGEDNGKEKE